jgi:hypothetical protein
LFQIAVRSAGTFTERMWFLHGHVLTF